MTSASAQLRRDPSGAAAQPNDREGVSTADFGCDLTGATNTTAALKAFYDHCIETGTPGLILAGTYLVTPGMLVFNNGFTDKFWPEIRTAGHKATTFRVDDTGRIDAPILTITNGVPNSPVGKYWRGGSHGGISIVDSGAARARRRHGLSLQGLTNCRIGYIHGEGIRGSLVHFPSQIYAGSNPDPTACSGTSFEGVEGIRCLGWTIENRNYVGMDAVVLDYVRGIENEAGVVYGCGQGCHFKAISAGSCAGRAWDDGTHADAEGGAPNRTVVENVEIDDCEYGIRLNRIAFSVFKRVRFNHRHNFGPLNRGGGYWPKHCYEIATGAAPNIVNVELEAIHRLEAGGRAAELGSFLYTTNPGSILGLQMDLQIQDGVGFGLTDADVFSRIVGLNENARATIRNQGRRIFNTEHNYLAIASHGGSLAIPTDGFGTLRSILRFDSKRMDSGSAYDPAAYGFSVPYTGRARVKVAIEATLPAGGQLRLGAMYRRGDAFTVVANGRFQAGAAPVSQSYEIERIVSVNAGDVIFAIAAAPGGPINATPSVAAAIDDIFEIEML